ncbi:MAG: methylenetetrahydrofolate reductase [NAD(P)H] [Flavobacteriales bacterium]|nr:methylenetetrahydrofolate reductase [NAD(P)H] [Flavobacteriales bacterium]
MKVTEHINKSDKALFSLEVLPPLKGQRIDDLFEHLDSLMEFEPAFVDVTYHREEFQYKQLSNGLMERRTVRKRPGTVGICAAIQHRYGVDPVPHIICGGFTKEETENALIDLHFLGIDNVLLLRGDSHPVSANFEPETNGHRYASELIDQVSKMNQGEYLDEDLKNTAPSNFCMGVAGYPEKHFESPNLKKDLQYLKLKQDLGAEYVVTQMFFDNEVYFNFVDECRKAGITIPIIPGLKPLTSAKQLQSIPKHFSVTIPEKMVESIELAKNREEVIEAGIEWSIAQSKELIKKGAPAIHFYTMGKSNSVAKIAKAIF